MDKIRLREMDGITWYDNEDIVSKVHELIEEYNEHRREYIAVLDRIKDILDRLRQLGG